MLEEYRLFLEEKAKIDPPTGLKEVPVLPDVLFQFQRDIVTWALKRGRAAIFAQTGLGKSLMELSWANAIRDATGSNVLILTPLAVAAQMIREAEKFGLSARQCSRQDEVLPGVTVTNYQKIQHFDLSTFDGVVLDESSILKSFNGKTRSMLIDACKHMPYRLAATATPAPNDFMELGNHAEFLGVMDYTGMLSTFFIHDGGDTSKWRLKGHAENEFWKWMCTWSVLLRKPSDLGYDDGAYNLPPLNQSEHIIDVPGDVAVTLSERLRARRDSLMERVFLASSMTPIDRSFVWWCNLNDESKMLAELIDGAVEVKGSDRDEVKEQRLKDFSEGRIRVLITKPTIAGFGMNWQHCADTGFVGLNDSFEQVYQAIRRFWRFGQTKPVNVAFIAASTEGAVLDNLKRKESDAYRMGEMMIEHMVDLSSELIHGSTRDTDKYNPNIEMILPTWLEMD